jgi:hypothetical protein
MMKICNLSYLETLPSQQTQTLLGKGMAISVEVSGEAIGDWTLVEVDLSGSVVQHEQGVIGVGTATVEAYAEDPEEASASAQLQAEALARVSRTHSGSYSIDIGTNAYAGGFIVTIAGD